MTDARPPTRLAACLLALFAAACNRTPPPSATPAAAPAAPAAEEKVVNVYNWSDYIAPDTIAKFEAETGIHVNYDIYDSNEVLETKLLAGRSGFDVVVPSANYMERQAKQGVYRTLDKSQLANYGNLDPAILEKVAAHDPGNAHAIPYVMGTTGIGWNVERVKRALGNVPVDSWAILFDPKNAAKLQDCGIAMLDAPSEIIDSALIYLGLDPNGESEADLAAAEKLLAAVRPYVRYFHSSQYITDLANGEICIAIGWNGDVLQARDRAVEAKKGVQIAYAVPKEGAIVWFDTLAIPADAPHPLNAQKFLDFQMRPEVAAALSNFRRYATGNAKAVPLVEAATRDDPGIYPPPDVRARLKPHLAESLLYQRLLTRAWTRVRTGR